MVEAYVVPYSSLLKELKLDGNKIAREVKLSRDQFEGLIKSLLRGISVDENWYRLTYPDVAQAIVDGAYKSAKHHFVENGYFEGRKPYKAVVDEEWYISIYPDVKEGIEFGDIASAQDHFETHGEEEGRRPQEW
jgi:hypothetical protein